MAFSNYSFNDSNIDWRALNYSVLKVRLGDCKFEFNYISSAKTILYDEDSFLESYSLCKSRNTITTVFTWLTLCLGVPSNVLALLTILMMTMSTGTCYVAILAAADLTYILSSCLSNLFPIYRTSNELCKTTMFVTNFLGSFSNWTLVLICLERWVTVRFPLQRNYYFTVKRAGGIALILASVLFLLNSFYIIVYGVWSRAGPKCQVADEYLDIYNNHLLPMSSYLYAPVPAILLFLFILLISMELRKHQKARQHIMGGKTCSNGAVNPVSQRQLSEQSKLENTLTIMLLLAAVVFVVLSFPLLVAVFNILPSDTPLSAARLFLFHSIGKGLEMFSHTTNFFIYFLSARKFRSQLAQVFQSVLKKFYRPRSRSQSVVTNNASTDGTCLEQFI